MAAQGRFRIPIDIDVNVHGVRGVENELKRVERAARSGQTPIDPATGEKATVQALTQAVGRLEAEARKAEASLRRAFDATAPGSGSARQLDRQIQDIARARRALIDSTREARRPESGARPLNAAVEYRRAQEFQAREVERQAARAAFQEARQRQETERRAQRVAARDALVAQLERKQIERARLSTRERDVTPGRVGRPALPAGQERLALPAGPQRLALPLGAQDRERRGAQQAAAELRRSQVADFQARRERQAQAQAAAAQERKALQAAAETERRTKATATGPGGRKPPPPPGPPPAGPASAGEPREPRRKGGRTAAEIADDQRTSVARERERLAAVTPQDRRDRAALGVEQQLARAEQHLADVAAQRSESGKRAYQAELQLERETAELRAAQSRMRSADGDLIRAVAAEANARQEEAARLTIARSGEDPTRLEGTQLLARAAVLQQTAANRRAAEITNQTTEADIAAAAEKKLAEAKLRVAIRNEERARIKAAVQSGDLAVGGKQLPTATWFQRLQFSLSPSGDKLPQEYMKGGQFFGDKFQRTVGYAASGALLGGATAAVTEMVQDATKLEQTFVRLRGQMEGIGESRAFPVVREQIRQIAAETGQASNDVAEFFSRMVGLSHNPSEALRETESAMKLMTVTGLDAKTMMTSIVPIQKAFGVSVEEIGDKVVDMGEKFGIAEDDFTQFLGKTAAAAKGAGLNFGELAALGGNLANSLGKPIDASSESINKSFTLLENNKDKILGILASNPATEAAVDPMIDAFAKGRTGDALFAMLRVTDKLTASQKNQLLTSVVSRREAEDFNAIIQNSSAILNDAAAAQDGTNTSAGKLQGRFKDLKDTVAVTGATIRAAFESLGDAIFRSGISEFIVDIGNALKILVGIAGGAFSIFGKLNEVLRVPFTDVGILGVAAKIAVTATVIGKTAQKLREAKFLGGKASDEETRAEARTTAGRAGLSSSGQRAAATESELANAKRSSAAAGGTVGGYPYNISGAAPAAAGAAPGIPGIDPRTTDAADRAAALSASEIAVARSRLLAERREQILRERRAMAGETARARRSERLARELGADRYPQPPGPPLPLAIEARRLVTRERGFVPTRPRGIEPAPEWPTGPPVLPAAPALYDRTRSGRWRDIQSGRFVKESVAAGQAYPFLQLPPGPARGRYPVGQAYPPIGLPETPLPRLSVADARAIRANWLEPLLELPAVAGPSMFGLQTASYLRNQARYGTIVPGGAPIPIGPGSPLLADPRRRIPSAEYLTRPEIPPIFPRDARALQAARDLAEDQALFGTARLALPAGAARINPNALRSILGSAAPIAGAAGVSRLALGSGSQFGADLAVRNLIANQGRNQGRIFESLLGSTKEPIPVKYRGALELPPEAIKVTGPGGGPLPPLALPSVSRGALAPWVGPAAGEAEGAAGLGGAAAAGRFARLRGLRDSMAGSYASKRGLYNLQYAQMAEEGALPALSLAQKATSGAALPFLRNAKADALTAATPGAKAGWSGSPGIATVIALAGAAAVKSAYDEQKANVDSQIEALKGRVEKYNAAQLKDVVNYHSGTWERIGAAVFGAPLAEDIGAGEQAFRDTTDFRRTLGGAFYRAPKPQDLQAGVASERSLQAKVHDLNVNRAKGMTEDASRSFVEALNESREGRGIAAEAGMDVLQVGELPTGPEGIWGLNPLSLATKAMNAYQGRAGMGKVSGTKEQMSKVAELLAGRKDEWSSNMLKRIQPLIDTGTTAEIDAAAKEFADQGDLIAATNATSVETAVGQLKDPADKTFKSMDELQADFDAGRISLNEFLAGKDKALKYVTKQAAAYVPGSIEAQQYQGVLDKAKKATEDLVDNSITSISGIVSAFKASGSNTPKQDQLQAQIEVLRRLPLKEQFEALPGLVDASVQAEQERINKIADPVARATAKNRGVQIDPALKGVFAKKVFNESELAAKATTDTLNQAQKLGAFGGMDNNQFRDAVAVLAEQEGLSPGEAAMKLIDREIEQFDYLADLAERSGDSDMANDLRNRSAGLRSMRESVASEWDKLPKLDSLPPEAQQEVNRIEGAASKRKSTYQVASAVYSGNKLKSALLAQNEADAELADMIKKRDLGAATDEDVAPLQAASITSHKNTQDARENLEKLKGQWRIINANGDPLAELEGERQNLLEERARLLAKGDQADEGDRIQNEQGLVQNSQNQARARLDVIRSGMSITEALVERSGLATAQAAMRRAEFEEQNAVGAAAKQEAFANRIKAQHQLEDVISQGLEARAGLASAIAAANDDDVGAAKIAADEASRKLELARSQGLTGDELAPFEAASVTANRELVRASVQDQVDTIDFMQGMGQISTGQAIASLQAVLATVKVGSKEYETLSLKIKQMTQSAQQDLQFNLPSTLGLPTLYEARRSRQSTTQGIGYQDNRNVIVSIAVNGAQDPAAVASQVSLALQSSLRGGSTFTPAVPVGAY